MAEPSVTRPIQTLNDLTAEQLRAALNYDPITGRFVWRERTDVGRPWNRRFAGKEAGYDRSHDGYRVIGVNDRLYLGHRLACLFMTGEWPPYEVDHINGNTRDNTWDNLRLASHGENGRNLKTNKSNKSGFKGVFWHAKRQTWHARITKDYRFIFLGSFATAEEASEAYQIAARHYFGQFARGDHPTSPLS